MQTIKSCTLDNGKRHVCFDDLNNYWRKDEYLTGLNDIEKAQLKQNLDIQDTPHIDGYLDKLSKNPVQNRVISLALDKKLDIDQSAKVALTGQYSDLKNTPCTLPNPQGLVIMGNNPQFYDGTERVTIDIPTKVSDLEQDIDYVDECKVKELIPIHGIRVNDTEARIDFEKVINIKVPTKLSDLADANNFIRQDEIVDVVDSGELKPVSSKGVYDALQQIKETLTVLSGRISRLEEVYSNTVSHA